MLDLYLRAEFNVMDTDKDGKLNRRELRNLLTLLGLKKAKRRVEERGENLDFCENFKTFMKDFDVYKKDDTIHIEDYVDIFKDDPELRKKTQRLRQLFRIFDKNSDGWASKEEIVAGLEQELDEVLSQHFGSQQSESSQQFVAESDEKGGGGDSEVERDGSVINEIIDERARDQISQRQDDDGSGSEDEAVDNDQHAVRQFLSRGCVCSKKCSAKFSFDDIYRNRLNVKELESNARDMLIMGVISKDSTVQSDTTSRGTARKRAPPKDLRFQGSKVCLNTFLVCYGISKNYLYAVLNHVKTRGVVSRCHGNTGKRPQNAFSFSEIKEVVEFIKNYADETGLPQPAAPRGCDNIPPIFLPCDATKKGIHAEYVEICTETGTKAVSLTVFKSTWSNCLPRTKIASPREDVCASCEKMRVAVMDARAETEKLEATVALRDHILQAQRERELYNECVRKSRQDLAYTHTFDLSQNVAIPHAARQVGPLYFLSLRKIQQFGFRIDGHPRQLNFLIDEHETIGADGKEAHGPNAVISMVDWSLQTDGQNKPNFSIHSDNCPGQNKNKYMMGYFMWRVMTGQSSNIEFLMQIPGHARCHVDAGFASVKKLYRCTYCETIGQLEDVANRSSSSNLAVRYPNWKWRNWKLFLEGTFKPLKSIRKYQYFRFSSDEPGVVTVKTNRDGDEEKMCILKDPRFRFVSWDPPAELPPSGLSQERLRYLYDHVRPYVRPALQNEFCAPP